MARRQDPGAGPRAAMIDSAVALIREQGVAATSFADVLAHSGAPRGSIYHHFPGGKSQLVEEATRSAAAYLGRGVARVLESGDTVSALRALVDLWRRGSRQRITRRDAPSSRRLWAPSAARVRSPASPSPSGAS